MNKLKKQILSVFFIGFITMTLSIYSLALTGTNNNISNSGKVLVLLYHNLVIDKLEDGDMPEYCTTNVKFEDDIKTLISLGYQSLNLEKYYKNEYDKSKNYFIVTFDDGYLSNYEIAYPILVNNKTYGDIFITTDNTVLKNHFKFSQGNKMEQSGYIKIYSHLTDHLNTEQISIEEFEKNVIKAYEKLEKRLKAPRLRIFAYPNSMYSKATSTILKNNDTVMQMVQYLPTNWDYSNYGLVRRINISYTTNIREMVKKY